MPSHTIKERLKRRIRRSDTEQMKALEQQEAASAAQKRERDKQAQAAQAKPKTLEQLQAERKRIGGSKEKAARVRDVEERVKREEERLRRISPLFHAENIRRPLLVIQGANDPRVVQVESDEMVAAVRKGGVPVEYIIFPDEGHGFLRRENRITAAEAYLSFLEEHLAK